MLFIKNKGGEICKIALACDETFEHLEFLVNKFIAWPNFVANDVIDLLSAGIIVNNPDYRGGCFETPKYLHGPNGFKLSDYQQKEQAEEKIRDEEKEVAPQPSVEDALVYKKEIASYRQLRQYMRLHRTLAKLFICAAVVVVANLIIDMIEDIDYGSGNR